MNATNQIRTEDQAAYSASAAAPVEYNSELIRQAMNHLIEVMREPGRALQSPTMVRDYLKLRLATEEREIFGAVMLDNRHRVIEFVELFQGTINAASVYPREVVKSALAHNAAAVILTHNHPSGVAEPSQADRQITDRLIQALGLVEVKVLDHIIIGGDRFLDSVSFAERGYI